MKSVRIRQLATGAIDDADLAHHRQDLKELLYCVCGHTSTIFDLLERMKNERTMALMCPNCKRPMVRLGVMLYTRGMSGSL